MWSQTIADLIAICDPRSYGNQPLTKDDVSNIFRWKSHASFILTQFFNSAKTVVAVKSLRYVSGNFLDDFRKLTMCTWWLKEGSKEGDYKSYFPAKILLKSLLPAKILRRSHFQSSDVTNKSRHFLCVKSHYSSEKWEDCSQGGATHLVVYPFNKKFHFAMLLHPDNT